MNYHPRPRPHTPSTVRRSRLNQSPQARSSAGLPARSHRSIPSRQAGLTRGNGHADLGLSGQTGLPRSHPSRPAYAPPSAPRKAWIAGGSVAFLAAIAILPNQIRSQAPAPAAANGCQTVVQKEARLSRQQLSQFLALPEQASKSAVQAVIQAPYCELAVTDDATAKDAYPLAFDPETWFVVEYTNDVYSGYAFTFQQE
mgnify:CR=1 FL=1